MDDDEITPVLFRKDTDGEINAVFPTIPGTIDGTTMTCYAHMGQHSSCSFEWYNQTQPARPEEYQELKEELEAAPYEYKFRVYKRITREHRSAFNEALRK